MTEQELKYWQKVTNASSFQWFSDKVTMMNGKGHLYYIGGENGYFMRISPEGKLTIGKYEYAFPHIGEAMFTIKAEYKFDNVNDAFQVACRIGGRQFLADLFKQMPIQ